MWWTPGWHEKRAVWAHWMTWERTAAGTNRRPGEPVPGSSSVSWASRMRVSISQDTAGGQEDGFGICLLFYGGEEPGECIWLHFSRPRSVSDGADKMGEKQCPPGLPGVELFG